MIRVRLGILEFRIWGLGFRVPQLRVLGFRGLGFRVWGFGVWRLRSPKPPALFK